MQIKMVAEPTEGQTLQTYVVECDAYKTQWVPNSWPVSEATIVPFHYDEGSNQPSHVLQIWVGDQEYQLVRGTMYVTNKEGKTIDKVVVA